MPRYRVRDGEVLPINGQLVEAGACVELPRVVADDMANRHLVQEVDEAGQPVAPVAVDDLERFRAHERVGFLRERLATAQAGVAAIQAQLDREEQALADAVKAAAPGRAAKTKPTADAAKE